MITIHPYLSQLINAHKPKPGDSPRQTEILITRYMYCREYLVEPCGPKYFQLNKTSFAQGKLLLFARSMDQEISLEERRLAFKKLKAIPRAMKAREELITRNLGLVLSVVKKYYAQDDHLKFSFGVQGLIKAVDNFTFDHNAKLSTFATLMIKQQLLAGLEKVGREIRLPSHIETLVRSFERAKYHLIEKHGDRYFTDEEIITQYLEDRPKLDDTPEIRANLHKKLASINVHTEKEALHFDQLPPCSPIFSDPTIVDEPRQPLSETEANFIRPLLGHIPSHAQKAMSRLFGLDDLPTSYRQVSLETGISIDQLDYYEELILNLVELPLFTHG